MSEMTKYPHGTFSWPELLASDVDAARKFYTEFFGWDTNDMPIGDGKVYSMVQIEGKDVGAMYQMPAEQREQGVPTHWLSYVTVDSVDDTVAAAKEGGGHLLHGPMDVFTAGRMAVMADPQGAAFALWQAKNNIGAQLVNQHGCLCWNELATKDMDAAKSFYTGIFGWETHTADMGGFEYTSWMVGERPNGGMMQMDEEWGDVPPHWMVYFAVDDCDAMLEKAKGLGASMIVPATDIPDVGRFAVLKDPQGAVFSIIYLNNPQ